MTSEKREPAEIAARQLRDRNLMAVVQEVARSFAVPARWILNGEREAPTVRARWAALYIGREIWGYRSKDLSAFFDLDHSSILYAIRHADGIYKENGAFRKLTDEAVARIWPTLPKENIDDPETPS